MKEDESNFPIDVNSRFVNNLQLVIIWGIKALAFLMVLVILWAVGDVVIALYISFGKSPHMRFDIDELLNIFGAFLVVLIAIEIFLNIILYLRKDMNHLKLVVATALMAIARKVIILDYDKIGERQLAGMGILIFALGVAYWFISRVRHSPATPKDLCDKTDSSPFS